MYGEHRHTVTNTLQLVTHDSSRASSPLLTWCSPKLLRKREQGPAGHCPSLWQSGPESRIGYKVPKATRLAGGGRCQVSEGDLGRKDNWSG